MTASEPQGKVEGAIEKPFKSVTFRPTKRDRRILDRLRHEGVSASDAVRRGLQLVEQERWLDQARADAIAARGENLNDEPDAW